MVAEGVGRGFQAELPVGPALAVVEEEELEVEHWSIVWSSQSPLGKPTRLSPALEVRGVLADLAGPAGRARDLSGPLGRRAPLARSSKAALLGQRL